MKNNPDSNRFDDEVNHYEEFFVQENSRYPEIIQIKSEQNPLHNNSVDLAEILLITSYPPRECGIATYSQDLIKAINNKFSNSLSIKVCALETGDTNYIYPGEVKYILNTSIAVGFEKLASNINKDNCIKIVLIQHEFGFFKKQEKSFLNFLYNQNLIQGI